MTLDGGMGVLAAFGDDSNFVVSVGGFHPPTIRPPLPFPDTLAHRDQHPQHAGGAHPASTPTSPSRPTRCSSAHVPSSTSASASRASRATSASTRCSSSRPSISSSRISASLSVKLFGFGLFSVRFRGSLEGHLALARRGHRQHLAAVLGRRRRLLPHLGRQGGHAPAARSRSCRSSRRSSRRSRTGRRSLPTPTSFSSRCARSTRAPTWSCIRSARSASRSARSRSA